MSSSKIKLLIIIAVGLFSYGACCQHTLKGLSLHKEVDNTDPSVVLRELGKAIENSRVAEDKNAYISSLNKAGSLARGLNQDERLKILKWLRQSIPVLINIPEDTTKAKWHYNVGLFFSDFESEIDTPLFHLAQAKRIFFKHFGESEHVAKCYHVEGDLYKYRKNDFQEAERCYENALLIRERIRSNDLRELARNHYNLATTNRSQQDYEKAISYGVKTIELVKKIKDPDFLERTYSIVGNIYRDMGDSKMARKYYLDAIDLNQQLDQDDLTKEKLAWHYVNLGEALTNDSLYNEAILVLSKARTIYRNLATYDQSLYLNFMYQMANTYFSKGDFEKSTESFKTMISLLLGMNRPGGFQMAEAYMGLADNYKNMERYDSAYAFYQQALISAVNNFEFENPSEKQIGNQYYVHRILSRKADLFYRQYTYKKDPAYLKKASASLFLAEKLMLMERNDLDITNSKWRYIDANYDVYEQHVTVLEELSRYTDSDSVYTQLFNVLESSKSMTLNESLVEAQRTGKVNIDAHAISELNTLMKNLFSVQHRLENELSKAEVDTVMISKLRIEFVEIDRSIQAVRFRINELYPAYSKIQTSSVRTTIAQVKRVLDNENQAMIEFFMGNKHVYGFCVAGDVVSFKKIAATDSVYRKVKELLKHFEFRSTSLSEERFINFVANSYEVYKMLAAPFEAMMQSKTRILIIPDGIIGRVPFEALIKTPYYGTEVNYHSLDYLIRQVNIGYSYSFSLFSNEIRSRKAGSSVLGMAFSGSSNELPKIQGADRELKFLAGYFKEGVFFSGDEATERNFKYKAGEFDIIHLAVHGRSREGRINTSSLFFQPSADSAEDNELHAYELYGMKLKARLAVLSACESGIGVSYKGEGLMSMASAFACAGTENIIMSLWNLNDQVATDIVHDFYAKIIVGKPVDEALASAKLSYLENSDEFSADPTMWASVVAYGRMNNVLEDNRVFYFTTFAVALFVVVMLFFIYRKMRS